MHKLVHSDLQRQKYGEPNMKITERPHNYREKLITYNDGTISYWSLKENKNIRQPVGDFPIAELLGFPKHIYDRVQKFYAQHKNQANTNNLL